VLAAGLGLLMAYFTGGAAPVVLSPARGSGFGNGLFHTPNITVIMSVSEQRSGSRVAIRSVLFNSSQSIGTAVVLLVLVLVRRGRR